MKRKILTLLAVVFTVATLMCVTALAVSADAEPGVTIAKFNLAFEDNTYLKYAVRFDGVADEKITENNIGMLYWLDYANGFVPGTEDYSSKTTGYTDISGVKHYVFEYTHIAAKQLTDYIYSVAYIELDGETYYSEPVKYSALEYAYNRLGKTSAGTTNAELKTLLNNMLAYGASAQQYFDYKEDRLATADFYELTLVGGTLPDGFTSGLYKAGETALLTAPETTVDGYGFVAWVDETEEVVSEECNFELIVPKMNKTYRVIDSSSVVPDKKILAYTVNSDGKSCTITGLGTYSGTEVYIPEYIDDYKVTSIGDKAFADEITLTKIVLSETVTSIGTRAFYGCTGLTEITIPESVIEIGTQIFYKATNLSTVYYNSSYSATSFSDTYPYSLINQNPILNLEHIKNVVFNGDIIPEGILKDSYVTDVVIGNRVTKISRFAFENCKFLDNVSFGATVEEICYSAFKKCTALTDIVLPDSVISIGNYAFEECSALSSTTVGTGLQSIGMDAFFECRNVTKLVVPSVDMWCMVRLDSSSGGQNWWSTNPLTYGGYLYVNEEIVTEIVISDKITSIGNYAFKGCLGIKQVIIPEGISTIGRGAFDGCEDLEYISIPDTVTYIDGLAFCGCKKLVNATLPDTISTINMSTFYGCETLTNIKIPFSVTSISMTAFANCDMLSSIVIPDSVTSIGERAFSSCPSLKDVYYTGSEADWAKITIGSNNDYLKNATIHFNYSVKTETTYSEGLEFTSNGDGTCYVSGIGTCADTILYIPPTSPKGDVVTSLGTKSSQIIDSNSSRIFAGDRITEVHIPYSVKYIHPSVWIDAKEISNISVHEDNPYYKAVDGNLYSKDGSKIVKCAPAKEDTEFTITENIIEIGKYAFLYCENIMDVIFVDTYDWYFTDNEILITGYLLSCSELSDTANAATYLKSTYCSCWLKKN